MSWSVSALTSVKLITASTKTEVPRLEGTQASTLTMKKKKHFFISFSLPEGQFERQRRRTLRINRTPTARSISNPVAPQRLEEPLDELAIWISGTSSKAAFAAATV